MVRAYMKCSRNIDEEITKGELQNILFELNLDDETVEQVIKQIDSKNGHFSGPNFYIVSKESFEQRQLN